MNNFTYYTPTKVVFGKGTANKTGKLLKDAGATKVLIHYGGGSVVRSGLLDRIKASLDEAGVAHVELGGVVPNPLISKVYEGIDLCRKEGVDFLLAVGGGSTIDSVKAIGYGLSMENDVWDLYEHTCKASGCMKLACVLTIAAAGSEMSNSSVITQDDTKKKRAYDDNLSRPVFAVMDPEITMTLPDYQTASGCADILMHTMERYFTQGSTMELTDSIAEALMRTVIKYAKVLKDDPKNYEARAEVMWASSLAHNGLTGCGNDGGDWATHLIEHELGGKYDVAHGAGLAAIWPAWARYVLDDCLPRFKSYAINVMGVEPKGTEKEIALAGIAAMEDFYRYIGMPTNLKELGVEATDEDIADMAARCAAAVGGSIGSAKNLKEADMAAIYKAAR